MAYSQITSKLWDLVCTILDGVWVCEEVWPDGRSHLHVTPLSVMESPELVLTRHGYPRYYVLAISIVCWWLSGYGQP